MTGSVVSHLLLCALLIVCFSLLALCVLAAMDDDGEEYTNEHYEWLLTYCDAGGGIYNMLFKVQDSTMTYVAFVVAFVR